MTWTVFEHNAGPNETRDDSPGNGGYKYVLFEGDIPEALWWWTWHYSEDPERFSGYPDYSMEPVWDVSKMSKKAAQRAPGEKEVMTGAVGVPETEPYEWGELRGRLDVKVVEVEDQ